MKKPAFCICANKDADQLCRNNCAADQLISQRGSYNVLPGCKIRSLISTSQYYIKRYDIFIDLPREETCFQHTL